MKALDITGHRFGRLTAITRTGSDAHGKAVWSFACDCGKTTAVGASTVKSGKAKSCGCLQSEIAAINGSSSKGPVPKHGAAGTPEYAVWKTMRQRCTNVKCSDFIAYGGRGILVCERWNDFAAFILDMGPRPTSRHSIDRINSNGNYEPSNCRWATDVEQANNRRMRGTGEYATQRNNHGNQPCIAQ